MGVPLLSEQALLPLTEQWPCRERQLKQLDAFLSPSMSSPRTLVIYGAQATGKSSVTRTYLEHSNVPHAIVSSRECVTGRHLLERTVRAVSQSVQDQTEQSNDFEERPQPRCESLGSLAVILEKLLIKQDKFVLVFEDVDRQREAPPTLIPALSRLGESIRQLVVVLVLHHPPPGHLHQTGVPHIHFGPYSREQTLHIISRSPLDIFATPPSEDTDYDEKSHTEDKLWLWPRFCAAVWDSLGENVARDLVSFRGACERLWSPFIAPIVAGEFGTRDFSKLLIAQRRLFQDENVLFHSLVEAPDTLGKPRAWATHELPYFAKWLLVAGYLASFNASRFDEVYFMKASEKKRRRKGGAVARTSNKPGQVRKIPRHLLSASVFTLDRLLAIMHAILPDDVRIGIDIYRQITTLTNLRLLARAGGMGSTDPLEPGGKWRVGSMVTWDYALGLARSVGFGLQDYVTE